MSTLPKFEVSQNLISDYKTKFVYYRMILFNGKKMIGHIAIRQHAQPYKFSPVVELRDYVEPQLRGLLHQASTFEIYNGSGAVTVRTGVGGPVASFLHHINDVISVSGFLMLPKEEAMRLIYSIHVEPREKPTQGKEAEPSGINFVQKLKQLKEAHDAGLISEEEYQQKRQAILSKM